MVDRPSIELDSWSLFQKYGFQDGDIIIHLIKEMIGVQNNPKFRYYDNGPKFIEQFLKKRKDKLDPDIKEFLTYFRDDIDLDDKLLLRLAKRHLRKLLNPPSISIYYYGGNHNPVRADERYKGGNEEIRITISFETMINEVRWIVHHPEHYKYVK